MSDVDYIQKKIFYFCTRNCFLYVQLLHEFDGHAVNLIRIVAATWGLVLRLHTFCPLYFMKFTALLHAAFIKWYLILVLDQRDYRTFCTIIVAMLCKTYNPRTVHWIICRKISAWCSASLFFWTTKAFSVNLKFINFFLPKIKCPMKSNVWNSQCKL